MGSPCGTLEVSFIEVGEGIWWAIRADRRGLQDFVIQGDGKLAFIEIRTKGYEELATTDECLGCGGSLNGIQKGSGCQPGLNKQESAPKREILEWREVKHPATLTRHRPPLQAASHQAQPAELHSSPRYKI